MPLMYVQQSRFGMAVKKETEALDAKQRNVRTRLALTWTFQPFPVLPLQEPGVQISPHIPTHQRVI